MQTINYENFETKIETYFNKRFFRQHNFKLTENSLPGK